MFEYVKRVYADLNKNKEAIDLLERACNVNSHSLSTHIKINRIGEILLRHCVMAGKIGEVHRNEINGKWYAVRNKINFLPYREEKEEEWVSTEFSTRKRAVESLLLYLCSTYLRSENG